MFLPRPLSIPVSSRGLPLPTGDFMGVVVAVAGRSGVWPHRRWQVRGGFRAVFCLRKIVSLTAILLLVSSTLTIEGAEGSSRGRVRSRGGERGKGRVARPRERREPSGGGREVGPNEESDVGEGRRLIDLSSHLYGSLVHAQQETDGFLSNAVFSPYTAVRILLALQQGASGRTLDELNLLLGPEGRNTETYTGLPECLRGTERFHDYSPGQSESSVCFLRLAESIYVATHEGDRRLTAYRNSISLNFGIDVRLFNFRSPVEAAREMNAYVQRRTGTLVRQVTSSEDLARGESPGIAITNVAVLQGVAWRVPFPKLLQGVFYGEGEHGEAHAQPGVDFMEVTVDKSEVGFEFLDEGSIAVLRIPFMDPRLAMFVIMPTENSFSNFAEEVLDVGGTLIDDLIGQAVVRRWQETRRRRRHEHGKLHIRLPRFRVLPGEQGGLDLLSSVDVLHLDHLTSNADFSRLSDEGQRLKVDMWRHASLIDVDQRGIMITDDDGDDSGSLRLRRRSDGRSVGPGDGDSSVGSNRHDTFLNFSRSFYYQVRYQPSYSNRDNRGPRGSSDLVLLSGHIVNAYTAQQQP